MKSIRQILSYKHKNNKFLYYSLNYLQLLLPNFLFRKRLHKKFTALKDFDQAYVKQRVNYYNKLNTHHQLQSGTEIAKLKLTDKFKVYFFDTYEYVRYFSSHLKVSLLFGDITHVPDEPSIVKSRPIDGDNAFSVVLKLNKIRHYVFIRDQKPFESKKNILIGRSVVKQPHRIRFYEMYFNHPLCDIGQINTNKNPHWIKNRLTIDEFLDYKFILCIEGYDVASNLKWVMSSNSLAVMPKPKYETWFMEGTLIPDYHYVLLKDDYSDLEEKLNYYSTNTAAALEIVKNANHYITQFKNKEREDLISFLVLEKYFYKTGQIKVKDPALYN
ncbi:MAG TPA: glycosyl transferase family 90 [Cyclobacteriaceae bacterium]|nr:glycosyl transferase family 90 [Cyclobacteriaceae bacterium]